MTETTSQSGQPHDAYQAITQRIDAAAKRSGRQGRDVILVAVTKAASLEQIKTLVDLGHRDLGENRVQQLVQRTKEIAEHQAGGAEAADASKREPDDNPVNKPATAPNRLAHLLKRTRPAASAEPKVEATKSPAQEGAVRWHMIGHLQRNKVKQVAPLVRLIHSVDSLRLAEELHEFGARIDPDNQQPIEILLQVNASGETSKYGLAPAAVMPLAEQVETMIHLRLRGLMTMAPYSDNPEDARPTFARTRELFEEMRQTGVVSPKCNILSMGMSGDFEQAIEEGANLVRVGRALFGGGG